MRAMVRDGADRSYDAGTVTACASKLRIRDGAICAHVRNGERWSRQIVGCGSSHGMRTKTGDLRSGDQCSDGARMR